MTECLFLATSAKKRQPWARFGARTALEQEDEVEDMRLKICGGGTSTHELLARTEVSGWIITASSELSYKHALIKVDSSIWPEHIPFSPPPPLTLKGSC